MRLLIPRRRSVALASAGLALAALGIAALTALAAQDPPRERREFSMAARRYRFEPGRLEVQQGDLVRITLRAEDIAHSFTVDAYRIAKRVAPGRPVTFEFLADQAGSFPFYCNLTAEEGCRRMRGELVVTR